MANGLNGVSWHHRLAIYTKPRRRVAGSGRLESMRSLNAVPDRGDEDWTGALLESCTIKGSTNYSKLEIGRCLLPESESKIFLKGHEDGHLQEHLASMQPACSQHARGSRTVSCDAPCVGEMRRTSSFDHGSILEDSSSTTL